ncbi:MAG: hypothetical protein BWY17_04500 [Deltaproteobacteria bacterium ADurb.Bin207]|nr:MAG: hypothetical protein BWY17_04500 [Deltaproteobacteria bacterium ADurb.Bin207]
MVCIHRDGPHAERSKLLDDMMKCRTVPDRQQRFGDMVGQGT